MYTGRSRQRLPEWFGYVAPMVAFVALTTAEGWLPSGSYPVGYAVKIAVVTGLAIFCREVWGDLKPAWRDVLPAVAVGALAWALWIGLDRWPGYPHLGGRAGYDPFRSITDPGARMAFLAVRFYGLVLLVPLIEELFWRSFLLRYLTRPDDWRSVPLGEFSLQGAALSIAAFAVAHPEWLAAAVTAALYTLLLRQSRSLFACFLAHAVTNAGLGVYVLQSGDWRYW